MTEINHKDSIIKIITAFYPDAKIYLFGSYSRGTEKQGSDIDVAIDVGKRLNLHERQFLWNLLDALPTVQRIDLVDLYTVPDNMRESILKNGIPWKT